MTKCCKEMFECKSNMLFPNQSIISCYRLSFLLLLAALQRKWRNLLILQGWFRRWIFRKAPARSTIASFLFLGFFYYLIRLHPFNWVEFIFTCFNFWADCSGKVHWKFDRSNSCLATQWSLFTTKSLIRLSPCEPTRTISN